MTMTFRYGSQNRTILVETSHRIWVITYGTEVESSWFIFDADGLCDVPEDGASKVFRKESTRLSICSLCVFICSIGLLLMEYMYH